MGRQLPGPSREFRVYLVQAVVALGLAVAFACARAWDLTLLLLLFGILSAVLTWRAYLRSQRGVTPSGADRPPD
ncbi:hypothetical protein G9U51_10650 [Calidifontibacter sp. DB0510]|uniref:Uncharacterized protein n=1 Tax=Metallococcus carri TaxID=1656884 RepID=A0A967B2B2_9MICO|nr:hypothetical protein [Metallococcus carri]NHN56233.1 hypothetical protein [Metallococcus carri]NOP38715.1 hypothetical protein [Calidifontibacter sp. DB2511S]